MYYDIIESSVCPILLAGDEEGLKHVIFLRGEKQVEIPDNWVKNKDFFGEAERQLESYFSGKAKILRSQAGFQRNRLSEISMEGLVRNTLWGNTDLQRHSCIYRKA